MCGVPAILAISAGSSVLGIISQHNYARKVNEQQSEVQKRNAQIAQMSFNNQAKALNAREMEEREAAASKLAEVSRRGMKAAGTLRAAAGGMSGGALEAAYQDVQRQELDYRFGTERTLQFGAAQRRRQMEGLRAGRAAQELRGVYTPLQTPNFLAALGRIAADTALLNKGLTS